MATLNGWQQLWVFVTVFWEVAVLYLALAFMEAGDEAFYLAFAVVSPVLLYVAGLGVAWIRRGFRQ